MARPGNLLTSGQTARDGSLGVFVGWLRGAFAGTGFETNDLSEREMRRIRAKQIDAITRLVPLTMAINLANVAIILFVFWDIGSNLFLATWGLTIAAAAALATRSWVRSRRRPPKEASRNAIRRLTIQSFILALAWGAMPVAILPGIGPTHQLIVACLMAGMISAGGFTLSTVPGAGLVYTWTMASASAVALLLCKVDAYAMTAVFLMIYAVFISRNVILNGRLFFDNMRAQLQLARQTETISLLLKEFQENASDWLWQTDAESRLIDVPERFVEVAQNSAPVAAGRVFRRSAEIPVPC